MNNDFGLEGSDIDKIVSILSNYNEVDEAYIFGR